MRRYLGVAAGAFGVAALLRRLRLRSGAPADGLRAKLAEARSVAGERETVEAGETTVDAAPDPAPASDVDARRRDVHERARPAAASGRRGARTSSRTGTSRCASTAFSAACLGNRSIEARSSAARVESPLRSASTTTSGNADASADTAPAAPAARPSPISASAPTNTSRPSSRYGDTRANGASDTFSPARFGACSRSRATTCTGTAYPDARSNSY